MLTDEKVVQIMPVFGTSAQYRAIVSRNVPINELNEADGTYTNRYYVSGLALTDKGRLLPILFDGVIDFRLYDPIDETWAKFWAALTKQNDGEEHSTSHEIFIALHSRRIDFEQAEQLIAQIDDDEERRKAYRTLNFIQERRENDDNS